MYVCIDCESVLVDEERNEDRVARSEFSRVESR
jgi:hypothetical protein